MESGDASSPAAAWAEVLPRSTEVHGESNPTNRRTLLETRRSEGRRAAVVRKPVATGIPIEGGVGSGLEWDLERARLGIFPRTRETRPGRQILLKEEGLRGVVPFLSACLRIRRGERWAGASLLADHAAALPLVSGIARG
ncbi:MAG: hypothetical protein ACUVYA_15850 [Planctomycetota bacterium]